MTRPARKRRAVPKASYRISIPVPAFGVEGKRPWIMLVRTWIFGEGQEVERWGHYTGSEDEDGDLEIVADSGAVLYFGWDTEQHKERQWAFVLEDGTLKEITRKAARNYFLTGELP